MVSVPKSASAGNPGGSNGYYVWYVTPSGSVNSWSDRDLDDIVDTGDPDTEEIGYIVGVYP